MTTDCGALAALLATLTMLSATPTAAQTSQTEQTPQPAPVRGLEVLTTPQTTQIPVPDAPKIVLPSTTPPASRPPRTRTPSTTAAKVATKPTAKPSEAANDERSASRSAQQSTPRPRPSSDDTSATSPRPAPSVIAPEPVTTPEPAPVPTAPATTTDSAPSVAPTPTPSPATSQESTLDAPETGRAMPLWLSLAVVVVVLAGLWFLRRRKPASRYDRVEPESVPEPIPEPAQAEPVVSEPVATPIAREIAPEVAAPAVTAVSAPTAPKFLEPRGKSPPVSPRARLACELRPLRAGLNLLSATVECEVIVTNTGTALAESIRAGLSLLTAHAGQDTDLAAFNAAPVVRPVAAPFALAPGETRTLRTVVAVAREAIHTMTAANRPMFVPVVAANLRYLTAGDEAQTARAWSIGIERVDSPKLAPFWLDAPARMYGNVAARPHATEFDS